MAIPIENIYFLLCYAWNKLDEKERVDVSIDDKTELLDLFAKVLITSSKLLLKRGIDKSYIDHQEEISGVKGKIEISQTLKRNLLFKQKLFVLMMISLPILSQIKFWFQQLIGSREQKALTLS